MVLALPNSSAVQFGGSNRTETSRRNARWVGGAAVVAGIAVAGGSISLARSRRENETLGPGSRPKLHHVAVDALCGAVGEVTALVALYPLDTIKVQCQARSVGTGVVMKGLVALGPAACLKTLYAGVGSAAIGAAAMGSIYLLAFFGSKRIGKSLADSHAARSGNEDASSRPSPALIASAAGAAASIISSVIEAPIEQFKVRTQAGASQGPMLLAMLRTATTQGIAPLYWSFLPFLLKSIPHDVAELFTFSQLSDLRSSPMEAQPGWQRAAGTALAGVPNSVGDMVIGAAAGAAAAVASMPFDVTFTRMSLNSAYTVGSSMHQPGVMGSVGAFLATARHIVAEGGGAKALFAGVTPRLLQTVPAGVVYWMAVEATRRALHERCEIVGAPPSTTTEGSPEGSAVKPLSAAEVETSGSSLSCREEYSEVIERVVVMPPAL